MEIDLNASVRKEHVPEIERINMTIKKQIQSVYTELIQVYGRVPGVLVWELVYDVSLWLNSLPSEDSVSVTLIPQSMITGQSVELTKNLLLELREYVHTDEDVYNSMESQTLEALATRPTRNSQGGH